MSLISLYTGLSGLQAHQTSTNVVADNIANINTTGYKTRSANFQDLLSQTLAGATGPQTGRSGTDPVQVGTGVGLKSVDTNFNQGSLQTTGRNTDLAINGEGFFILSDGTNQYYTRDGSFSFDALGQLVNPSNGMVVQGNLADANGSFGATTGLQNIQMDLKKEIPGVATSRVNLSGNLDPGPVSTLSTGTQFTTASTIAGGAPPGTVTTPQQIEVRLTTPDGLVSGIIALPSGTYSTIGKYVDAINAALAGNERLAGQVVAQENPNAAGTIQLRTTSGGSGVQLNLADVGTGTALTTLGFGTGTGTSSAVASGTTALNDLSQVGTALNAGDVLRFSGTRADGSAYTGSYTVTATSTLQNLADAVASAFGDNVTAGFDQTGKLQLTDNTGAAVSGFTITTSLVDSGASSGLIGGSGLAQQKISTTVYDSQGRSHTMDINMAETPVANKWTWSVKIDNQTPSVGGSGTAVFDQDGSIRSFTPTEGEGTVLEYTPDGEVLPIKINFSGLGAPDRGINGLTQFASPSTADVVDQNGRAAGRLDTVAVQTDGVIRGQFTNGQTLDLARINLANFENPGGLQRLDGNLYSATENTGNALIELPTKTIQSTIQAGSLELSNVDMAQQLSNLIVAQRGYQANARVVTTSDQLLAETVNLKQ